MIFCAKKKRYADIQRGIKDMYLYEYIFIFISGLALGIIARYILGYKKHRYYMVAVNIFFGVMSLIVCDIFGGVDFLQIFLSGIGGIFGTLVYILLAGVVIIV